MMSDTVVPACNCPLHCPTPWNIDAKIAKYRAELRERRAARTLSDCLKYLRLACGGGSGILEVFFSPDHAGSSHTHKQHLVQCAFNQVTSHSLFVSTYYTVLNPACGAFYKHIIVGVK